MNVVPKLFFNDGHFVPILGLGTWKSEPRKVLQAVMDAIDLGYRHIDCALFHRNEKEVGEAIACKLSANVVTRDELFITSKLWNTFHRPDLVEGAFKQSLDDLGLSYLDLYLMHWPMAYKEYDDLVPRRGKLLCSEVSFVDTWKVMEGLVNDGFVKSIGVANFNSKQIKRLLGSACIAPVTNQVECHPYLNQQKLIDFCNCYQIVVTGYSPLGSPDRPWARKDEPVLLDDCLLKKLAEKYGKSPAQIALRYQIQRKVIVIPKSVTRSRIQENINIFNFELNCEDMDMLSNINKNRRYMKMSESLDHPDYPFVDDHLYL